MPESRNKTVLWAALLIAVIVGVLLIAPPKSSVSRIMLFHDTFNDTVLDTNKWTYGSDFKYSTIPEHELLIQENTQVKSMLLETKHKYTADILVFSMELYNYGGNEASNGFEVRSTAISQTNLTQLYNYIQVKMAGYYLGTFQVTYVTNGLEKKTFDTQSAWQNETWYKVEVSLDRSNHAFSIWLGQWDGTYYEKGGVDENQVAITGSYRHYQRSYESGFSNWYSDSSEGVYLAYRVGQLMGIIDSPIETPRQIMKVDNVEIYSEIRHTPHLELSLIVLAILSGLAILVGSVIYANCKHVHILMTCMGILGFCGIIGLLLNVWWFTTWSLLTTTAAIWCWITLITHESWTIDYRNYEQVAKWALAFGIIFTILSFLDYLFLYLTNYIRPFWW